MDDWQDGPEVLCYHVTDVHCFVRLYLCVGALLKMKYLHINKFWILKRRKFLRCFNEAIELFA